MDVIVEIVLSTITALTAIVAVFISIAGIKKSNKQSLFDRRLNVYLNIKWMTSLCDENNMLAKTYINDSKDGPLLSIDFMFNLMTNCSYLEEVQGLLSHTLESEYQRKFLLKLESLKSLCEEARLIFSENIGSALGDFIYYYEEMLLSMYKYQIALDGMNRKYGENNKLPNNDKLENACREKLIKYLSGTFELSCRLWNEGILEKVKKTIKL